MCVCMCVSVRERERERERERFYTKSKNYRYSTEPNILWFTFVTQFPGLRRGCYRKQKTISMLRVNLQLGR